MQVENCVQSKVCMGVLGSQGDRKGREERKTAEEKISGRKDLTQLDQWIV